MVASVFGLTEFGEKIRIGRLAGMVGTAGLALALAPVGTGANNVVGAASGFVKVSSAVVLVIDATTRLDIVMKENCELIGGAVEGLTVLRLVGRLEDPFVKIDDPGADNMVLVPLELAPLRLLTPAEDVGVAPEVTSLGAP